VLFCARVTLLNRTAVAATQAVGDGKNRICDCITRYERLTGEVLSTRVITTVRGVKKSD